MKRSIITLAAISAAMLLTANTPAGELGATGYEMPETTPATQPTNENLPQLPPGHPDMSQMRAAADQYKAANGGAAALPQGHPPIAAKQPMQPGALPSGHPDISSMQGANGAPATQPSGLAALTVTAIQGTIGGPAIGADDIKVEVYDVHTNKVVAKVEGKMNDEGKVRIGGLPVGVAFQPVITVTHGGVDYQAMGEPTSSAAEQALDVKVFETTDKDPGWEVRMRHVMIQSTENGVQVMEMLAVDNASDRAFTGIVAPDGSKLTFKLPIPATAKDVQLAGGFHDCCTKIEPGQIVNTMAIVPGTTQFQFSYTIPLTEGKAELLSVAPATIKHLMIFAPDDGTDIIATGAGVESGTTKMGGKNVRFYKGTNLPPGSEVKLTVSGTPTKAAASNTGGSTATSPLAAVDAAQLTKVIAGVGALLIGLFGAAFMFKKPTIRTPQRN